ncbi:hypothetical protein D187_005850 [Cystobacter fuscus DSM 2262]|uniref:Protein kinase domain-containing protein n=1 Tax=Cystobacter fuscus (strain ATCC 25194 / DSM 2262 / NBRC 100088 / M29) TaxID=1242864 RepID=S9QQ70_CYSF2|nr:serine/threonine-protein kinase [Cystobacter fuscus]EPX63444.1 hypothetical protein D187_005850 [Cystobacter fuscus DSM 2262]
MKPQERYRLEKAPLGTGGYASVFRATHKETGQVVALKRLKQRDSESLIRLKREIDVLRKLKHEHIMPLLDSSPLDNWYTMPLAEGTLADLRGQLDENELLSAIQHAAMGLAFAHELDFVHRDVTPWNILALRDSSGKRRWVIADWGLVRRPRGQTSRRVTRDALGTEGYLAPESWKDGHAADARADIYGLGRVVAWAVTGERLIPNIQLVPEGFWKNFVQRTTELELDRRPKSMVEALELLRELGAESVPLQVLVWKEDEQKRTVTSWMQLESGALQSLGETAGLLFSEGEQLWKWRVSMRDVQFPVLTSSESPEPVRKTALGRWLQQIRERMHPRVDVTEPGLLRWEKGVIEDAHLDDVLRGYSRQLSPLEPYGQLDPLQTGLERTTQVISSLGRLLFITAREWTLFSGAAHGNTVFDFYVYDAVLAMRVEMLSAQALEPLFREERDMAFKLLQELETSPGGDEFSPDDISLTLYRPFYDESGKLKLELQFTSWTAYGASDGAWSSYTHSVQLTSARIPDALHEFVSPPESLGAYLAAKQEAGRRGWSTVGVSPAARKWLEDSFARR